MDLFTYLLPNLLILLKFKNFQLYTFLSLWLLRWSCEHQESIMIFVIRQWFYWAMLWNSESSKEKMIYFDIFQFQKLKWLQYNFFYFLSILSLINGNHCSLTWSWASIISFTNTEKEPITSCPPTEPESTTATWRYLAFELSTSARK